MNEQEVILMVGVMTPLPADEGVEATPRIYGFSDVVLGTCWKCWSVLLKYVDIKIVIFFVITINIIIY